MSDHNRTDGPRLSFDAQGVQWAWDSTSMKLADECPRKYFYKIIEGWESPYRSVHLWFGGIYAGALERFHKFRADGADYEAALQEVFYWALVESWDHNLDDAGNRIPNTGAPAVFDDPNKNRETLLRTIVWYLDHFKDDKYKTLILTNGKAAVEHSFQLPVDNGIFLCGHNDRLVQDVDGNIFVHDQKTTKGTIGVYYFKQFKPDMQMANYTFAGQIIYNVPVSGVIIDAAQIAVGFTRFGRMPIYYSPDELNEWYDETMGMIEGIQAMARKGLVEENFPRRIASCDKFGGCQFREICSRPPKVRHNFLMADFKQGPKWDPAKPRI